MAKKTNPIKVAPKGQPILEVKNLRVSFTTYNGTVKAVRGISFPLYKERTLAIVGESGSGKSVSSKAILGILAGNKIIEDGEILFDGKDLLQISEEDFVNIRGSRIAMIFQDPLSSLNPIMRVGKQIAETIILKNQSVVNNAKKNLKNINNQLKKTLGKDIVEELVDNKDAVELVTTSVVNNKNAYDLALKNVLTYISSFKEKFFNFEVFDVKRAKKEIKALKDITKNAQNVFAEYKDSNLLTAASHLKQILTLYVKNQNELNRKKRFALSIEAKKAKGKNVEDALIKEESFSSEIQLTQKDVFDRLVNFINELENHVIELRKKLTKFDEAKEALNLIKYMTSLTNDLKTKVTKKDAYRRAVELLGEVGIPEPDRRVKQYPFELSGGMRQRVVIAIGLASNPDVLICDEPTTALDVTIQAQILELINKIKKERHLSIIFITHNLGVVANMADDIAVMYAGKIVEYGDAYSVFYHPAHPYTWALLASMPDINSKERLHPIPGTPPNMIIPPKHDAFADRNEYAMNIDFKKEPPLFKVSEGHFAATWLLAPGAPKVNPPKIVTERIRLMKKKNGLGEND